MLKKIKQILKPVGSLKILRMKNIVFVLLLFVGLARASAQEGGMWLPTQLDKNINDMQQMGCKLSVQDIYDDNRASMKDAVVIFGGGCTGELISGEGLLLTNYHCGLSSVQSHSTIEHDYLADGFWAMSKNEELPCPGLIVKFLEYMEDVTDSVLNDTQGLKGLPLKKKIRENSVNIQNEASQNGKYNVEIKPLFYGNQYFLYAYKTYQDVRLVGAPPSTIGAFGGNTDNFEWPRQTCDFSLFRIYAGKNNEPAAYSPENVPFKPKQFFPVSMKGIQPGDFTMILGNPGKTMEYLPHQEVDIIMNQHDPDRVKLKDIQMQVISNAMEKDPKLKIQYADEYMKLSNVWKKWEGELSGLKRLDAVNKKKAFEEEFKNWAIANHCWENKYKQVFSNFEELYAAYAKYLKVNDYYDALLPFMENSLLSQGGKFQVLIRGIESGNYRVRDELRKDFSEKLEDFYKNYNQSVDEQLFVRLLTAVVEGLPSENVPEDMAAIVKKYNSTELLDKVYRKSIFTKHDKAVDLLKNGSDKQILRLKKDPLMKMYIAFAEFNSENYRKYLDTYFELEENMKSYMCGLMEMKKDRALSPDANFTLRVAYGKVNGYNPKDWVHYEYNTTLSGVMEKNNQALPDYRVPEHLKELYQEKDFGSYEVNGDVPVAFIATNHIAGGNSGSPVINGKGELIGVAFDECWEGTMGDIMYDPNMCRSISLDIRYALFIIDKYAGAGYLLNEMNIIK